MACLTCWEVLTFSAPSRNQIILVQYRTAISSCFEIEVIFIIFTLLVKRLWKAFYKYSLNKLIIRNNILYIYNLFWMLDQVKKMMLCCDVSCILCAKLLPCLHDIKTTFIQRSNIIQKTFLININHSTVIVSISW